MTAEVAPGITVPLRPFWGSVGVAPAAALGRVSSTPPSRHAGNIDNKELVAGTTLYIPVFVKGALLEIGNGHGAQGDGEVDQTAIETNLEGRVKGATFWNDRPLRPLSGGGACARSGAMASSPPTSRPSSRSSARRPA